MLLPAHIIKEIATCLLPDIIAFYETEEGQRQFNEWKENKEKNDDEKTSDLECSE